MAFGCSGTKYYLDGDQDSVGSETSGYTMACSQPAHYSTQNGDCADNDERVFPGNAEVCDGRDNNCNGQVDEGFDVGASCTAGIGACQGAGTKVCTANGQGTQCNATPKPNGTACNDGHICTVADSCQAGICTSGTFLWSDVLQPINADDSSIFKLGSTIPVKFKLTGACAGITNLIAKIYVAKFDNGIEGTVVEATSTAVADSGNTFRYDPTSDQYIFNLATKSLSQGTWQIRIEGNLHNPPSKTVLISSRK